VPARLDRLAIDHHRTVQQRLVERRVDRIAQSRRNPRAERDDLLVEEEPRLLRMKRFARRGLDLF